MKLYWREFNQVLYQFGAYTESISIGSELARIRYYNHAISCDTSINLRFMSRQMPSMYIPLQSVGINFRVGKTHLVSLPINQSKPLVSGGTSRNLYFVCRKAQIIWSWRGFKYNICSFRSRPRPDSAVKRNEYEFVSSIKAPADSGYSAGLHQP